MTTTRMKKMTGRASGSGHRRRVRRSIASNGWVMGKKGQGIQESGSASALCISMAFVNNVMYLTLNRISLIRSTVY